MILQRIAPLLETPLSVFDRDVITPNDQFYVRWHWGNIPESIDTATFRLTVRGHVEREVSLTLAQLLKDFEPIEYVAVNQCSGNSRGLFQPSVPRAMGAWGHGQCALDGGAAARCVGARGGEAGGGRCALWRAGRGDGGRRAQIPQIAQRRPCPGWRVMIAYAMNGAPLPMLNGFPLRLVVPGWYSTYWVKMLSDIEVLPHKDENFWMAKAYQVPAPLWPCRARHRRLSQGSDQPHGAPFADHQSGRWRKRGAGRQGGRIGHCHGRRLRRGAGGTFHRRRRHMAEGQT
jgi:DMSO/TMAO reductase YedYZ molybdopterin-dependent catalytic subunit